MRAHHNILIPPNMDDWFDLPRTSIHIHRNHVFEDAIKAASKSDFDVTKLLQVQLIYYNTI